MNKEPPSKLKEWEDKLSLYMNKEPPSKLKEWEDKLSVERKR